MLQSLLATPPVITGIMYGLDGWHDNPELADYEPWWHAELLGARIVSHPNLPAGINAAYSHSNHVIFYRAGLHADVERCAIAHELVHYEHRDRGTTGRAEIRACRNSTLRLIRPSRLAQVHANLDDLAAVARELEITENVMSLYARMAREGTLPRP